MPTGNRSGGARNPGGDSKSSLTDDSFESAWACVEANAAADAALADGWSLRCNCVSDGKRCEHEIPITDELAQAVGEHLYGLQPDAPDVLLRCRQLAASAAAAEPPISDSEWACPVLSDEAAAVQLRLLHQRMGHASIKILKQLHSNGELMGCDLSPDQFACIQFFCKTCAATRGTKKPHARRRRGPPSPKRILERVYIDVAGPRKVPSLHHTGPRGNLTGGGNYYTVFYLDAATERGFTSFITHKSDLEQDVARMRAHLEMEAKDSVEYDGSNPIKVQTFASDRDSNLTSNKAIAQMLKARIHQRYTAADGKNQTPFLDGMIRRVQDATSSLIKHAGLPPEYWEFAEKVAMSLVNSYPSKRHRQHHSPMHRWTGRVQDLTTFKTFGADALVHLEPHERGELGDKLEPKFAGGDGTYRYLGSEDSLGSSGMGQVIINTKTSTLSSRRNVKIIENDAHMQNLEVPIPNYPDVEPEDVPIDTDLAQSFVDHAPDAWRSMDEPIPTEGKKQRNPPPDPIPAGRDAGAPRRVLTGRATPTDDQQSLSVRQDNPKQRDSLSHTRYEKYKPARTVREFLNLGGTRADLRHDLKKGFIILLAQKPGGANAGWCSPPAALSTKHAATAAEWASYAVEEYAQNAVEYLEKRSESDQNVPEGISEEDKLLPIWEMHSGEGCTEYVDRALGATHTLAREFAQWHHHSKLSGGGAEEMQKVTDMAEAIFHGMRKQHHANLVEELKHMRRCDIPTPKRFSDAIKGDFKVYWLEAIEKEIQNLTEHSVFTWVQRPPGKHLIDSNWAWKVKANDKGQVSKFKARLVARGFRQIYGVDYVDTMSPVGKLTTFRILIAEAAHRGMDFSFVDIRSAYLEAELKIKQYMTPPKGVTPPSPGMVMRLDRGLYGLRQSGKRWHEKFRKNLLSWGFKAGQYGDQCLFTKRVGNSIIRVLLFVDDMAIFHDSDAAGVQLKDDLIAAVKKAGYQYSTSDDDNVYLGMAVSKINSTCLRLSQERYIKEVMLKFGIDESNKVLAPSMPGKVTVMDCPSCKPEDNPRGRRFRQMTGALRWIEQCTRPDISATLSELSKVQINPGDEHVERLEHLMCYVSTTRTLSLVYGGPSRGTIEGPLSGYVDSDWAGDPDTYYSRGGHIHCMWGTPISWQSQKMKAVAASSTESEYMAGSRAVRESVWLRYLLSDMGYGDLTAECYGKFADKDYVKVKLSKLVELCRKAMTYMQDNKGAVAISKNPVLHKRSKHIHIAYHIVRRMVLAGHCSFCFIPTKENVADLMTKGLAKATHQYLVNKIMYGREGNKLTSAQGKVIDFVPRPAVRDTLYSVEPLGLEPGRHDSIRQEQISLPIPFSEGPLAPGGMDPADRSPSAYAMHRQVLQAPATPVPTATSVASFASQLYDIVQKFQQAMLTHDAPAIATFARQLYDILDSGASYTYVGGDKPLLLERAGVGYVSVANGHQEAIAGKGSYGSITSARRVSSFPRNLISVSDIIEQFGFVVFDREGAFVISLSPSGHERLTTRIADRTDDRLFAFDSDALSEHAENMKTRGMDPAKQGQAGSWVSTMGAREGLAAPPRSCGAIHSHTCGATWPWPN